MQPSDTPKPVISIGSCTHVGQRRSNNQDFMGSLYMEDLPYSDAHLVVVADGMGGAKGGEVASRIAVESIIAYFQDQPNLEPDLALREATEKASNAILAEVDVNEGLRGMGTTSVAVLAQNGWLFAAHVGDSRIYLLREGTLHRLTRDHSNVHAAIPSVSPATERTRMVSALVTNDGAISVERIFGEAGPPFGPPGVGCGPVPPGERASKDCQSPVPSGSRPVETFEDSDP